MIARRTEAASARVILLKGCVSGFCHLLPLLRQKWKKDEMKFPLVSTPWYSGSK
jgi:hypothetical protein